MSSTDAGPVSLQVIIAEQGRSVPMPGGNLPIESVLLHLDKQSRARSLVVRFPAGFTRDAIGHYAAAEDFLVLDGAIELVGERFSAGDWGWVPPNATRWGFSSPEGALVYAWFSQGNEFVEGPGSGGDAATRFSVIEHTGHLRPPDPVLGSSALVAADMPVSGPAEILELDTRVWQRLEAGAQTQTRTFSLVRYEGGVE